MVRKRYVQCLPVTFFAAGVATGGSCAGSVALGFARIFPRKTSHMFIGVGSPHGAVEMRTVGIGRGTGGEEARELGHKLG